MSHSDESSSNSKDYSTSSDDTSSRSDFSDSTSSSEKAIVEATVVNSCSSESIDLVGLSDDGVDQVFDVPDMARPIGESREDIGVCHIDGLNNSMSEDEFLDFRKQFKLSEDITLRLPKPGERPSHPPSGEVLLHPHFFKYGLRLPLKPIICKFLKAINLAPGQLSPNSWRSYLSMIVLYRELDIGDFTFSDFKAAYCLKSSPKKGWYYHSAYSQIFRDGTPKKERTLILDNKNAQRGWNEKWFFAGGAWAKLLDLVPNTFNTAVKLKPPPSLNPSLFARNLRKVILLPLTEQKAKYILSP